MFNFSNSRLWKHRFRFRNIVLSFLSSSPSIIYGPTGQSPCLHTLTWSWFACAQDPNWFVIFINSTVKSITVSIFVIPSLRPPIRKIAKVKIKYTIAIKRLRASKYSVFLPKQCSHPIALFQMYYMILHALRHFEKM